MAHCDCCGREDGTAWDLSMKKGDVHVGNVYSHEVTWTEKSKTVLCDECGHHVKRALRRERICGILHGFFIAVAVVLGLFNLMMLITWKNHVSSDGALDQLGLSLHPMIPYLASVLLFVLMFALISGTAGKLLKHLMPNRYAQDPSHKFEKPPFFENDVRSGDFDGERFGIGVFLAGLSVVVAVIIYFAC